MARFLSPAWAEAYNEALVGVALPLPGPDAGLAATDGRFTMAQEVRGTPDGDIRLVVAADVGSLHFRVEPMADPGPGDDPAPDVTIVVSYADAVAMSTGELSPAEALNGGRIRVRGDLSVLVAAQAMIDAARRLLEGPAAATTY
jgi:hypothetical protein